MRKIAFWPILITLMLLMLSLTAGLALAEIAPFHSGDALFSLQQSAEQLLVDLNPDPGARVETLMDLFERRINDLDLTHGSPEALAQFDQALNQMLQALVNAPEHHAADLRSRAMNVLAKAHDSLDKLASEGMIEPEVLTLRREVVRAALLDLADLNRPLSDLLNGDQNVLATSLNAVMAQADVNASVAGALSVGAHTVAFQPGSVGAMHTFFPLTGKHAKIECAVCHVSDQYAGLPTTCIACHSVKTPTNHFPGECSLCHSTDAWKPARFDHTLAGTSDCQNCHIGDKPAKHWDGQCSQCHSTNAWKPANFNHAAAKATDCLSCHSDNKPANHWSGQCSQCHTTNAWKPANFNHAAAKATDCLSCHTNKKPANHFAGQCSLCHSTTTWKGATFKHAAVGTVDCQSCHTNKKPANHFAGQCSLCHSTTTWKGANFNHAAAKATDCQNCHAGTKPANHYAGQCSLCHSTTAWKGAIFNHAAAKATDCQSCHANKKPANHSAGQCSLCHSTSSWKGATFNHAAAKATDCQSCHAGKRPANHFTGQCSSCHTTTAWKPATFKHSFNMNHGGANGRCASCHTNGGTGAANCFLCHNKTKLDKEHANKPNYATRCLECHK